MNFLPVMPPEAVQIGTSCFAVVFGEEAGRLLLEPRAL